MTRRQRTVDLHTREGCYILTQFYISLLVTHMIEPSSMTVPSYSPNTRKHNKLQNLYPLFLDELELIGAESPSRKAICL